MKFLLTFILLFNFPLVFSCSNFLDLDYLKLATRVNSASRSQILQTNKNLLKEGSFKVLNKVEYKVLKFIDGGGEGNVYLVEKVASNKKFILKEFVDSETLMKNQTYLRILQENGVNTPHIYSSKKNLLILEYIEGVIVFDIMNEYKELGMNLYNRNKIIDLYKEWSNKFESIMGFPVLSKNVLFNLKTKVFTLIDPF